MNLGFVMLTLCFAMNFVWGSSDDRVSSIVAVLGVVSICFVCVFSMLKLAKRDLYFILLPEFWFYFLMFLYFGVGSSAVVLIPEDTEYGALLAVFYQVLPSDVNKLNRLIQFSLIFQIGLSFLARSSLPMFKQSVRETCPPKTAGTWYHIYLFIWFGLVVFEGSVGGIVKELTHYISYGFLFHLTRVVLISKHRIPALVQLFAFLVVEIRFGFLIAAKIYMILPLLVIFMGYVSVRGLSSKTIQLGGALLMVFSLLIPLTEGMRQKTEVKIETNTKAYAVGFLQYGLYRLSHVQVSAYLLNDESGKHSTITDWYTVLVPRIIYPDKPNISFRGNELAGDLYGFDTTSIARSVFVDAFVSAGWGGLIFINFLFFLVFFLGRYMSFRYAINGNFTYLPLIFMNIFIVFQLEGVISTSLIAPLFLLIIMLFLTRLANGSVQKK